MNIMSKGSDPLWWQIRNIYTIPLFFFPFFPPSLCIYLLFLYNIWIMVTLFSPRSPFLLLYISQHNRTCVHGDVARLLERCNNSLFYFQALSCQFFQTFTSSICRLAKTWANLKTLSLLVCFKKLIKVITCKEITNSIFQILLNSLNKKRDKELNSEKVYAVSGLNTDHA